MTLNTPSSRVSTSRRSILVGGVATVEHPFQCRPFHRAMRTLSALGIWRRRNRELRVRTGDNILRWDRYFRTTGHGQQLRLAGPLQTIDVAERLTDGLANRQQTMVAQNHHFTVAEVFDQPLLLIEVDDHALKIMIRNPRPAHSGLRERQQSAFEGGHTP